LPSERHFVLASDWPYRSPSGGFTTPVQIEGVVVSVGRRHGPRARSNDRSFRGQAELVMRVGMERVSIQFDAPEGPLPVEPGRWVSVEAHALAQGGRQAYFLSVRDHAGKLLMAGYSGVHFDSVFSIPGWSFALGPAVEAHPYCGGEVARRTLRIRGPGGEAVLWPGYRSVAPLGNSGSPYEVDVQAARSVSAPCVDLEHAEVSVFVRRAER